MNWRRRTLVVSIVIVVVCLYKFALPICTTAKLLGHDLAFEFWRGPISRSATRIGAIPIDIYEGSASRFPVVLVHGVNETGKDSLELRTVAEALAGAGYRVIVPELVRLTHQNVTPQDVDDVLQVFKSLGAHGGIVCASYGCGPALIAASRAEIRDQVRFIATFGAYFDMTDTLRFIVTGPSTELAYSKWVYMRGNLDLLADEKDQRILFAIAGERENKPPEEWILADDDLGADGRALLALYDSKNPAEFDARLYSVPALKKRLEALSPSRYFSGIRAHLIMMHMAADLSIPSSESIRMAAAAKALGLQYDLTILNMFGHTKPVWPAIGIRSFLAFYLPQGVKFFRVVSQVLSYLQTRRPHLCRHAPTKTVEVL